MTHLLNGRVNSRANVLDMMNSNVFALKYTNVKTTARILHCK